MDKELDGKIALITGASKGIGRAIALILSRHGAIVALNYHSDDDAATEVEREIKELGGSALKVKCSIANYPEVESMVKEIKKQLGPIDILINNAGVLRDKFLFKMEAKDWLDVINTNLIGVFNVTRSVVFSMMRKRKGKIVNVASLNAIVGSPGQTNYTASKGGIIAFTKSLSKELGPLGINVNAIAPGYIETDMLKSIPEEILNHNLGHIPLGRFGSSEEVAELVLFLTSERSNYITGQVIKIDGGLL